VNQIGSWQAWDRGVNSNMQQAPSSSVWKTFNVIFDPNVTDTSDDKVVLSFDLMSFDMNDGVNSWVFMESVKVEEVLINP
jgi:hypothetical protein